MELPRATSLNPETLSPGAISHGAFRARRIRCVLENDPADEDGLRHFTGALGAGESRAGVLRSLVLSEEFDRRSARVSVDTQLCELANPAKWDNDEWLEILRSLGLTDDKLSMHRKP